MHKYTKIAFIVLILVGFIASMAGIAYAGLLKELDKRFKVSGDIMTLATYLDNYRGIRGKDEAIITRSLLALDSIITDKILLRTELGYWRNWENYRRTYHISEADAPQTEDPVLANAYLELKDVWKGLNFIIGRQFMGEEEDAFFYFGPHSGRFLELTAIDAVKANKKWGRVNWSAFFGKRAKMGTGIAMEDNYNDRIFGIEAQSDEMFEGHNLRMGTYYRRRPDDPTDEKSHLILWTLKGNGRTFVDNLAYGFLLGINAGKNDIANRDYAGWLARIKGEYKINLGGNNELNFNGGYVYVTGDSLDTPGKDENFRRISRDCFFSMALLTYEILNDSHPEDVVNVKIPFFGAEFGFWGKGEQIENKIYKYYGIKTENKAAVGVRYAVLDCTKTLSGEEQKATEVNAYIKYELNKNTSFQLIGARFWPKGFLEKAFKSGKPINQISLYTEVRF